MRCICEGVYFIVSVRLGWHQVTEDENCLNINRCARLAEGNTVPNRDSWMKIRVDLRTYKLVYEAGGEEGMWRGVDREEEVLRERARVREEERRKNELFF